ncbi:MAG: hypothetical protein HN411_03185 [Waddliaceae bacterium]|jgi:chemotaxis protein methyltransferase CheR|nr:hypothetical protein [Waddliaceae bacterium]MBT3578918.1 hypothetical protein [Waddliaceae bacterium]MBT4445523.1 hypothetical protein [Waddliaceae bacterium]MBT6929014.1 hypothetical protein [Waddliaceae bacterium]MBT7264012.1 hypothetical protein [Waddliaceae bacterium]
MLFTEEMQQKIGDFVTERTGLYFRDYQLKGLEETVIRRAEALRLPSIKEYYRHITTSQKHEDELRNLLNLLTINHTYFFRNEPHFKALKEEILPKLIAKKIKHRDKSSKTKPILRIWSAGCSTGEEPYSIAIVIKEILKDREDLDVKILATDASTEALKKARQGIYSENHMKLIDKDLREKYFTKVKGDSRHVIYKISDEIKDMVEYSYLNLMEEGFPKDLDIIFCRNVVIYFELETTVEVMNKFNDSLTKEGYMISGHSESPQFVTERFVMEECAEAIVYRKAEYAAAHAIKKAPPKKKEPIQPIKQKVSSIIYDIAKAEVDARKDKKASPEDIEKLLVKAKIASYNKKYGEAFYFIERVYELDKENIDARYLEAEIYANRRKYDVAKDKLQKLLAVDALFVPAYYLLGCIFVEEGGTSLAKKNMKKALFLDDRFSLANFGLATIYKQEGHIKNAMREFRNTIKTIINETPETVIAYGNGFNVATMLSTCRNNIERLKYE